MARARNLWRSPLGSGYQARLSLTFSFLSDSFVSDLFSLLSLGAGLKGERKHFARRLVSGWSHLTFLLIAEFSLTPLRYYVCTQLDYSPDDEVETDLSAFDPSTLMRALTESLSGTLSEIKDDEEDEEEITPQTLLGTRLLFLKKYPTVTNYAIDILNEQENEEYNSEDDADFDQEVLSLELVNLILSLLGIS